MDICYCFANYKHQMNFKLILFTIILFALNVPISSFKYFKAFNILSNDILLITDVGIIKYNIETDSQYLIVSYTNIINEIGTLEFITEAHFSSDDGGYIICRINEYIYILSKDASYSFGNIILSELHGQYIELIPYITKDSKKSFIICYIDKNLKIALIMHEININKIEDSKIIYQNWQVVKYSEEYIGTISLRSLSCKIMNSDKHQNILTCFVPTSDNYCMNSISFEQDNNFTLIEVNKKEINTIPSLMAIDYGPNKEISLICLLNNGNFQCLKYYSTIKEWSNLTTYLEGCSCYQFNRGLKYINEEHLIYCYSSNIIINYKKLDNEYNIKNFNDEGSCSIDIYNNCYTLYTSTLLFNKNENQYSVLTICSFTNGDTFRINDINDECKLTIKDISSEIKTTINSIPISTSIIKLSSSSSSSIISSSIYKQTIISTIINQKSSVISTSINQESSVISTIIYQKTSVISTSINQKSTLLSTVINQKSSMISIAINPKTSEISTIINQKSSMISTAKNTINKFSLMSIDNGIDFYEEGEVIKGITNKPKEEIDLDILIDSIEIGKKYEIDGDDYNIRISPVNLIDTFNSTYVEFSICEQILRKEYNLSENETITILQIEIDKMNENALTNQVEYEIYNSNKTKLSLSYCKDVKIKVHYEIKDPSLINKTKVSQFSDLGIDIFNNKDSFFNDICHTYSDNDSDIILKDRVLDIYQNYSLCDNGCEYEQINIDLMTVICSCQIKTEINVKVSEPVFGTIIEDSFKDSNFGVILCYNLVFGFDYKRNVGFWIFLCLIFCNIILFIIYFMYGINSIKIYVFQEMRKNNYILKISPSPPLRKTKKKSKTNAESHHGDAYNSSSNNNFIKDNRDNNLKTVIENIYKPNIKKKKRKKNNNNNNIDNNIDKKIKIKNPIMIVNYTNKYYNFDKKMKSYNSTDKLNNYNKHFVTSGFETKVNNKNKIYTHKGEIEKKEYDEKCPGYYNLIQIDANNEKNNEPPESLYILNNYDFYTAIKYEKRSFWRIYYICILSTENVINTFIFRTRLEVQPLRLSLFIFSYTCDLSLNAFFYLNKNISDKYHYQGNNLFLFTLVNNLTIDIVSTVSSYVLVKLLNYLNSSKESIENVFRTQEKKMRNDKKYKVKDETIMKIYEELNKIYKYLKIKIISYIFIDLIFLVFFLYYITAFCEVYKNTQISWLTDSFVSFLMSILVELFMSFLCAVFYKLSIKYKFKTLYIVVLFFYELG